MKIDNNYVVTTVAEYTADGTQMTCIWVRINRHVTAVSEWRDVGTAVEYFMQNGEFEAVEL